MATPAETVAPAETAASVPADEKASIALQATQEQMATNEQSQPATAADNSASQLKAAQSTISDTLGALGSMWSGWMATPSGNAANTWMSSSAAPDSPALDPEPEPANAQGNDQMAAAAAAANEWLQGAGKMWESAVKDVGSKLKSAAEGVDTAALGEQVNVIREKSGRLVEDVSKSVQSMNLNIDQDEIQKRASVISTSTKNLIHKASQSLQQGRKEALEIFVDADPNAADSGESATTGTGGRAAVAPWDKAALPESEQKYADTLRQEMLKIVVDAIYSKKKRVDLFLSEIPEVSRFDFDLDKSSGMAMAALDADKNMRRLRAGLVPGKMKEDAFWKVYFYHVHRVRQTLVANDGVMPETSVEEDEDPAALFAEDDEDEELAALDSPPANAGTSVPTESKADNKAPNGGNGGKRNWDDEIDAIFDEDE